LEATKVAQQAVIVRHSVDSVATLGGSAKLA